MKSANNLKVQIISILNWDCILIDCTPDERDAGYESIDYSRCPIFIYR